MNSRLRLGYFNYITTKNITDIEDGKIVDINDTGHGTLNMILLQYPIPYTAL